MANFVYIFYIERFCPFCFHILKILNFHFFVYILVNYTFSLSLINIEKNRAFSFSFQMKKTVKSWIQNKRLCPIFNYQKQNGIVEILKSLSGMPTNPTDPDQWSWTSSPWQFGKEACECLKNPKVKKLRESLFTKQSKFYQILPNFCKQTLTRFFNFQIFQENQKLKEFGKRRNFQIVMQNFQKYKQN